MAERASAIFAHTTMELGNARNLFEALRHDRVAYGYSGAFQDEHSVRLIALGESAAPPDDKNIGRGKLAYVMVEAYQNIIRHRAILPEEIERGEGRSLFLLRTQEGSAHVMAVNPMKAEGVPGLEATMAQLAGRDRSELKEMFMSGLQRAGEAKRRGAGLGLIEMARRSGNDLAFMMRGLGEDHRLLILAIRLGPNVDADQVVREGAVIVGTVVMQDVLVFHKGEWTPAVEELLLHTVQNDLDRRTDRSAIRGRVCLAMFDAMRNAVTTKPAFVAAVRSGEHDELIAGGVMTEEEAERLEQQVNEMSAWDSFLLQRHYREAIVNKTGDARRTGLLELMREAAEPLRLSRWPTKDGTLVLLRVVY